MKRKNKRNLFAAVGFLGAFALWTAAVSFYDVQPIGPGESTVGFAAINRLFHSLTGVHMTRYAVTDWLGLVPIALALGFACYGLVQWVQRKQLRKVDADLLLLGLFYLTVMSFYLLFEAFAINYRPVLIAGNREPSYPSSTTLLVLCVMPTARLQFSRRIRRPLLRCCLLRLITAFTVFMVVGRLVSGVHWLSDIIGGVLLSAGLTGLYRAFLP